MKALTLTKLLNKTWVQCILIHHILSFCVCFQITEERHGISEYSMYNLHQYSRNKVIVPYVGMAMDAIGFLCCLLSFVSTCQNDRELSKKRQCFVNPWIIWNFSMVACYIVYIAWVFQRDDHSVYNELTGALVLSTFYRIICALVGVSYMQSLNENVSDDIVVIPSDTKPPPYEQIARNDGYVMMAYIPNSEDPPSYSENRDDDQWTDWKLGCKSLW